MRAKYYHRSIITPSGLDGDFSKKVLKWFGYKIEWMRRPWSNKWIWFIKPWQLIAQIVNDKY